MSGVMAKMEQYPDDRLKKVAHTLIARFVTNHADNEVRLLGACCVCDVLRVCAPDAPYDERQIETVFQTFFAQVRV
jgi:sister-chromatid-cohesion protein PDS5